MAKFTRIAYASQNLSEVLADLVADAGLNNLPTFNSGLWPRPAQDREKVRVTILVEREPAAGVVEGRRQTFRGDTPMGGKDEQ